MAAMSSWRSSATTERLAAARIVGAKGLAGAVRIEMLTDWPEHLAAGALVYLEGEDQPRRVRELQAGNADTPVVISADKTVKYEAVVKVMDTLQRAGVLRVGLAVKQTGG